MAYTRLLQNLTHTYTIAMVADKTKDSEMYETFSLIHEALETKKSNPVWKKTYEAYDALKALIDSSTLRKWPPAEKVEAGLKAIAKNLAEVTLSKEDKNFALLLVGAFEGLCLRCEHLDKQNTYKNAIIKSGIKKYNQKGGRRENLDPLMESVTLLRTQIQNLDVESAEIEAKQEPASAAKKQKEAPENLSFSIQEERIKNICELLIKCNLSLKECSKRMVDEISDYRIKEAQETLESIEALVLETADVSAQVESAFHDYHEDLNKDPEFSRLRRLEEKIEDKLTQGKVIEYDENLAAHYHLSQDEKDAWRQRAYIDYSNVANLKSLYNRARETASLFQTMPIFGHAAKAASSAARYLPGAQRVMGSEVSYKEVMQRLKKAVVAEKNILVKSPLNLEKYFPQVHEQSQALLHDIKKARDLLKEVTSKKELTHQHLDSLKNGIQAYVKANNGLVSSFLRLFGVGASRYELAQDLLNKLSDKNKPNLTLTKLSEIVKTAQGQLVKPKKDNKLDLVLSEHARKFSS